MTFKITVLDKKLAKNKKIQKWVKENEAIIQKELDKQLNQLFFVEDLPRMFVFGKHTIEIELIK
jgi:hypothetical protein